MCLVSFSLSHDGKAILTSNRDEAPSRSAENLNSEDLQHQKILYPKDTKGGSWFVIGSHGSAAIILNGAFQIHKRHLPYRISRGIMLKQMFEFNNPHDFIRDYNFMNIEPFTMVIYSEGNSEGNLLELRWDGSKKFIEILDVSKCHIWSSCTLYNEEKQQKRESIFRTQLKQTSKITSEVMLDIHLTGSIGDKENDFVMNRENRVKTMSVTQAIVDDSVVSLNYKNLIFNVDLHQSMAIEK